MQVVAEEAELEMRLRRGLFVFEDCGRAHGPRVKWPWAVDNEDDRQRHACTADVKFSSWRRRAAGNEVGEMLDSTVSQAAGYQRPAHATMPAHRHRPSLMPMSSSTSPILHPPPTPTQPAAARPVHVPDPHGTTAQSPRARPPPCPPRGAGIRPRDRHGRRRVRRRGPPGRRSPAVVGAEHAFGGRVGALLLDVGGGHDLGGEVEPLAQVVEAFGGEGVVVPLPGELRLEVAARGEGLAGFDDLGWVSGNERKLEERRREDRVKGRRRRGRWRQCEEDG